MVNKKDIFNKIKSQNNKNMLFAMKRSQLTKSKSNNPSKKGLFDDDLGKATTQALTFGTFVIPLAIGVDILKKL